MSVRDELAEFARSSIGPIDGQYAWSLPTKSLADLRAIGRTASTARRSPLPDLVRILRPAVVIVHGTASREGVETVLGIGLPAPAPIGDPPAAALIGSVRYFTLLSLSPPQANKWLPDPRATEHLALLARQVADAVATFSGPSVES